VLDVGAGTGRDAAWLTRLGYDVLAVEPSAPMRAAGEHHHPNVGLRWIVDQLPGLRATHKLNLAFDLILLSGVWQHVAPGEREQAMRKLRGLLRPGGVLALTLRHGPANAERAMHHSSSRLRPSDESSRGPRRSLPLAVFNDQPLQKPSKRAPFFLGASLGHGLKFRI
jgi:SAM-dependent methyltransferase